MGYSSNWHKPSTHGELGFEERLALLVDREVTYRGNTKITRLLLAARLKLHAAPEDIDYHHPQSAKKPGGGSAQQPLGAPASQCVAGPTGCGKTYLGCVLGVPAWLVGTLLPHITLAGSTGYCPWRWLLHQVDWITSP